MSDELTIEELLVRHHYLMQNQLDHATHFRGQDMDQSIEELLMDLDYMTEGTAVRCVVLRDHIPVVDLGDIRISLKAADMVSSTFMGRSRIIPIDFGGNGSVVAAAYPVGRGVLDGTAIIISMEVKAMFVTSYTMEKATEKTYGNSREKSGGSREVMDISFLDRQDELLFIERVESIPVIHVVDAIVENTYSGDANDIHAEPDKHDLTIRMRINGDSTVRTALEMEYHRPMMTRFKLIVNTDTMEKRLPQDGKYHYEKISVSIDLRISTLPTIFEEEVVLGLLRNDKDNFLMDTKHLSMNEKQKEVFERILEVPHGVALVTGPIRSSKTTTLYTVFNRIVGKKINVVTVEGPTEKVIGGITQTQINPKSGSALATALHSILRQDPGMIMVGEMRGEETVSASVRTAVTGYLIPSTLYTNDCTPTINRLHNMGVSPYMAMAAFFEVVSQRLVRLLYPECRRLYAPDEREKRLFGEMGLKESESLFRVVGCPCCSGTGYVRRKAVYKLTEVDGEVKSMILDDVFPRNTRPYQRKGRLKSIKKYALQIVPEGETSMEEAEEIAYSVE